MRRATRLVLTLVITGLALAYLLSKIDLSQTWDVLSHASLGWYLLAVAIMAGTVWPMAWRWQRLLLAQAIPERLAWLARAYFVAYTAGQILPTSIGGDAMRIFETSRRHPGKTGPVTGTGLLERALGGAATVTLAAVGFALAGGGYDRAPGAGVVAGAVGRHDTGPYIWVSLGFVFASVLLGVPLFSRRARRLLAWF